MALFKPVVLNIQRCATSRAVNTVDQEIPVQVIRQKDYTMAQGEEEVVPSWSNALNAFKLRHYIMARLLERMNCLSLYDKYGTYNY